MIEVSSTYTYIEKKSKFIGLLYKINSKEQAKEILEEIRLENKDARHICYAYKVNGTAKLDDDGEPKGTAGKPIYQMLELKHLENVLMVVVRYFGGTKLGASHLLRAYVKAASETINIHLKGEK